jgi:hypothetical protein
MKRYVRELTLKDDDGVYHNEIYADSIERAYDLAVSDVFQHYKASEVDNITVYKDSG